MQTFSKASQKNYCTDRSALKLNFSLLTLFYTKLVLLISWDTKNCEYISTELLYC